MGVVSTAVVVPGMSEATVALRASVVSTIVKGTSGAAVEVEGASVLGTSVEGA